MLKKSWLVLTVITSASGIAACGAAPASEDTGETTSGLTTAVGTPAAIFGANQQHVYFRGSDGAIYQSLYDQATSSLHAPEQWATDSPGGPAPAAMFDPGASNVKNYPASQHVLYVDHEARLQHVWYDSVGGLQRNTWGQNAEGTPAVVAAPFSGSPSGFSSGGRQNAFYRAANAGILHVYKDWNSSSFTSPAVWGSGAVGNPAAIWSGGQTHVFYRDAAGNIWHVYCNDDVCDQPGASTPHSAAEEWVGPKHALSDVPAASDPAAMYTPNGQQHLFYRGTDNNLYHVYYDPATNSVRQTEKWVVGMTGTPATMVSPNQQHLFFLGGGPNTHNIYHVYYDGATNGLHQDSPWATNAEGNPAAMYNPNGQQSVFYLSTTNHLDQVMYNPPTGGLEGPTQWW